MNKLPAICCRVDVPFGSINNIPDRTRNSGDVSIECQYVASVTGKEQWRKGCDPSLNSISPCGNYRISSEASETDMAQTQSLSSVHMEGPGGLRLQVPAKHEPECTVPE